MKRPPAALVLAARTADGASIETTVDGTIDVDEADCSSTLYVDVDGERVVEIADFDRLDD